MVGNTDAQVLATMRHAVTNADLAAADALSLGDIVRDPEMFGVLDGVVVGLDEGIVMVRFDYNEGTYPLYAADLVRATIP